VAATKRLLFQTAGSSPSIVAGAVVVDHHTDDVRGRDLDDLVNATGSVHARVERGGGGESIYQSLGWDEDDV